MKTRTKVVFKKEEMVHASMKLWHALTDSEIFAQYQQRFLFIFKRTPSNSFEFYTKTI